MKYCKFCGAEIPDGEVCHCAEAQNEALSATKTQNKNSMAGAFIAIIAGVIIIFVLLINTFSGGYDKPVDQFFKGIEKCSVSTMAKSFPEDVSDSLKDSTEDEDLESLISLLEIAYGKNIKISYDIKDKTSLKKDEINSLEKTSGLKIDKAYKLDIEVEFKGKRDTRKTSIELTSAKIKGEGWKLLNDVSSLM